MSNPLFLAYSLALERVFDGDQETLNKGHKLAEQVQEGFGADSSEHDCHFHLYTILFPFESTPELTKEYVDGIWYPGHGGKNRQWGHGYVYEPVSFFIFKHFNINFQNSTLRQFYDLCYDAGVHPFYFKPFQNLTATQSAIIEAAIIKSIGKLNFISQSTLIQLRRSQLG